MIASETESSPIRKAPSRTRQRRIKQLSGSHAPRGSGCATRGSGLRRRRGEVLPGTSAAPEWSLNRKLLSLDDVGALPARAPRAVPVGKGFRATDAADGGNLRRRNDRR